MSRIGKKPIIIPDGVKVSFQNGLSRIEGPKGIIERGIRPEVKVEIDKDQILVSVKDSSKKSRAFHGLFRSLIANDVQGVTELYTKELELVGVGYRAEMDGDNLVLRVGFSHPVTIEPEEGINIQVKEQRVSVTGIRKDSVGQMAAKIRSVRPPEPYKGKGIRYLGEEVRRKEGKKAVTAAN